MSRRLLAALAVGALVLAATAAGAAPPPPSLVSATTVGNGVLLRFDARLKGAPPPTAFVITANGSTVVPVGVQLAGRSLRLVLPQAVYADDTVRVRYAPFRAVGGQALRDDRGRTLAGFVIDTVNKGPAGCSDPLGKVAPGVADEGPTDTSFFLPSTGRLGLAYIPVDFSDTRDGQRFSSPALPPGSVPAALPATISSLSYGKLSVVPAATIGMARMSKVAAAYGLGVTPTFEMARPFLQEAVDIASVSADLSQTDAVVIEMNANPVTPVPSGLSGRQSSYEVIAPPGQGIVADGRTIRAFVFVRGRVFSGDTLVPALLHLLGLPDLSQRQDQLGLWDATVYAFEGASLFGWHRRKLGWLDPTQVQCVRSGAREVRLEPLSRSGGVKLLLAPLAPTRAIAVELRRLDGSDARRCRAGLLVTRIDTAVPIRDPLVTPPMRVVLTRPPTIPPFGAGQPICGLLYDQVLDGAVPSVSSDGVTVRLVSETPDGAAVVRIER